MPDLTNAAISSWIAKTMPLLDPLHNPRTTMNDEQHVLVETSGLALDEAELEALTAFDGSMKIEQLRRFIAHLDMVRRLRVMAWLLSSPAGERMFDVLAAGKTPEGMVICETLRLLGQLSTLEDVFGLTSIQRVRGILDSYLKEIDANPVSPNALGEPPLYKESHHAA